jgi:hypothetical protein
LANAIPNSPRKHSEAKPIVLIGNMKSDSHNRHRGLRLQNIGGARQLRCNDFLKT